MIDPNLWNQHGTNALFAIPVGIAVWIWHQVNGINELKTRITVLEEKLDFLISLEKSKLSR